MYEFAIPEIDGVKSNKKMAVIIMIFILLYQCKIVLVSIIYCRCNFYK